MNNIHTTYKQEIVFARILIPFTLGIISFYGIKDTRFLNLLILINISLFTYLLMERFVYKKGKITKHKGTKGLILHLLLYFSGGLSSTLYNQHIHTDYYAFKKQKYLKIRISNEPEIRQNIILFNAFVSKSADKKQPLNSTESDSFVFKPAFGKIKLSIMKNTTDSCTLKYGDELIIPANFIETPPALNPSEFDFKSWLAARNIYHQSFLNQEQIVKLNTNTGNALLRFAIQLRKEQVDVYRKLIKNNDAFAVATTLILGYRADLSAEIMNIYSKTGTIHVLSVSGMHVGLLYFVLNSLLWFLNKTQTGKIIKALFILSSIWFYTLLTGFSPSVLRASIMISIFIVARIFSKNTNSYNIVAFAAFCLLLYNPFFIWDVGFQLSFIAVIGLIYLQPKIQNWVPIKHPWLAKIWSITAMSLAAQLATYPFSVYYFHQFPLYFLVSNLFITLPAALIMYIGVIILLFNFNALGPLFEWLLNFTNAGLNQIAGLPFSGITAIWLSKAELILLCLSLILFITAWDKVNKQLLFTSLITFFSLQSLITYDKIQSFHQKKTVRYVLKKNYAFAAISAHRAVLYTDLKPGCKIYNHAVKPALDQHRVTEITFKAVNVTTDLKDNLIFDQHN
ncbi:ComEC/Rec2 family competence protein [Pedobacter nyackensis]|uniref:ComEC/Rec2 family competence protein n=1 Tax=Pedobacter nyackensis TaxID=475255 RepID=UPI00292DD213|nr:ComEC/Rec2 family competence protein [Pedobacter nyackensis]